MLSPLLCLNVGSFSILKIPLPRSEQKKVRSCGIYDYDNMPPYFTLKQVFIITKEGWLSFNINYNTVNIFNDDVDGVFIVCFLGNLPSIKSHFPLVDPADESFMVARYVSSYMFIQSCNLFSAAEILEGMDDYLLSRLAVNAYGFDDKQFALNQLRFAIKSKAGRYVEGKKKYIYDPTKPDCVFEILKYLMLDQEAVFYPLHPKGYFDSEFVIGKNKQFVCHKDVAVPFNKLRWDAEKVDLSVSVKIHGYVELNLDDDIGLPRRIETFTKRSFHFIRNGVSENARIYFNASAETIALFKLHDLIKEEDGKWCLDFSSLPIISKKLAKSEMTGPDIHKIIMELIDAKKNYYSLLYIKNKLFSKNTAEPFSILYRSLSERQKSILQKGYNLTENGFSFVASPIRRGLANINFYVSHKTGEIDISKLAFIVGESLTPKIFSPEDLKASYEYLDLFSFHFFDYIEKNRNKTIDTEMNACLKKIVELEYTIQHFRMICIISGWWSELVRTGVCGYKCEQGDLVFTEESLYA
jgi:hypothetical protein